MSAGPPQTAHIEFEEGPGGYIIAIDTETGQRARGQTKPLAMQALAAELRGRDDLRDAVEEMDEMGDFEVLFDRFEDLADQLIRVSLPHASTPPFFQAAENVEIHYNGDIGQWVAIDEDTGIGAQGDSRNAALQELDQAVAMHYKETTPDESEEEMLEEFGVDSNCIDSESESLPEFLQ